MAGEQSERSATEYLTESHYVAWKCRKEVASGKHSTPVPWQFYVFLVEILSIDSSLFGILSMFSLVLVAVGSNIFVILSF